MRRSKLEIYAGVLRAVVVHGPLKVTWLSLKVKANYVQLKPALDFLLARALVEQVILRDGGVGYSATSAGEKCFQAFNQLGQMDFGAAGIDQGEPVGLFAVT